MRRRHAWRPDRGLGVCAGSASGRSAPAYASSSAARDGARGLIVRLESLGYAAHPRTKPLTALDSDTRALIVLPGKRALSSDEVDQIMGWVAEGNTLVYATGESGADAFGNSASSDGQDPLLSELDVRLTTSAFDTASRLPQPVIVGGNVPTEAVFSNAALATTRNGMVPLLTRGSGAQAMMRRSGQADDMGLWYVLSVTGAVDRGTPRG